MTESPFSVMARLAHTSGARCTGRQRRRWRAGTRAGWPRCRRPSGTLRSTRRSSAGSSATCAKPRPPRRWSTSSPGSRRREAPQPGSPGSPAATRQGLERLSGRPCGRRLLQRAAGAEDRHRDHGSADLRQASQPSLPARASPGRRRQRRAQHAFGRKDRLHAASPWREVGRRSRGLGRRRGGPYALHPALEPAHHQVEKRYQQDDRDEEQLRRGERSHDRAPPYLFGPAGGSGPPSAMASRIVVSAWTFFIR